MKGDGKATHTRLVCGGPDRCKMSNSCWLVFGTVMTSDVAGCGRK